MSPVALLRKFPSLDLTWPPELQERWWRVFRRLYDYGLRHRDAPP
jgi:hypothetical protein